MTTAARPSVVPLRSYQREALAAVLEARDRDVTRQLISMPTGSGKTVVAAHLVAAVGLRTVFLVHRDELAQQAMPARRRINPDLDVGLVKAERDDVDADVIVASAATLAREQRVARLARALAGEPLLMISDECHHDLAPSRHRAIERLAPTLLVGLTATPTRGDRLGLDAVYDDIVFHVGMIELMAQDRLARLRGLRIESDADLDGVHTRAGEFAEGELSTAVNTPARNALIVESWRQHAADRRRTVIFCVDVRHALAVRDAFRVAGVRAETVLGETPPDERRAVLEAFHRGEIAVLTNCMVLTEGYDEPAIDCIVMARPTKSRGLYVQCVGRGARKAELKADCLVLDVVDVTRRHKLVTFPTLIGDRVAELAADTRMQRGEPLDLLEHVMEQRALGKRRAVEVDLFGVSPLIWRSEGLVHFAPAGHSDDEERWIVVVPEGAEYRPYVLRNPRDGAAHVEPAFDRPVDIEMALGIAEDAIPRNALTDRGAAWRRRNEPPTERQARFARQLGIRVTAEMTKAQLSDLIDEAQFRRVADRAGLNVQEATHV